MLKNFLFDAILFMLKLYTDKETSQWVFMKNSILRYWPQWHAIISLTSSYGSLICLTKNFLHEVFWNNSDSKD